MAEGRKCSQCKSIMLVINEDEQPKGSWVYYQCINGNCNMEEKHFEPKE